MTARTASRVRLRPFRLEDAADLCRIYSMSFVDNAVHFGGGRTTVAESSGRVVGFVMWGPAFEPAWFDPGVKRWAELHELHVEPAYRNRGIGTRLVRAAIRQARKAGYPVMYLLAEEDNIPARKVYAKAGFREHNRAIRYRRRL